MNKMILAQTILVDIDRTIADYDGRLLELAIAEGIFEPDVVIPWEQADKIHDYFPEKKEALAKVLAYPHFYEGVKIYDGAKNALEEMKAEGIEVKLCSAFSLDAATYHNLTTKTRWVERELGKEWVPHLIHAKDKSFVRGDYLIDDKPVPLKGMTPSWTQILFDQPYNQHLSDKPRLMDWSNWRRELKDYL